MAAAYLWFHPPWYFLMALFTVNSLIYQLPVFIYLFISLICDNRREVVANIVYYLRKLLKEKQTDGINSVVKIK